MPLKHLDNDSSNKSALKRKSQSIIVGGAWHIIMVKNHPLGIPLQPYSLSCLSLLEPFNEQIISSRMLCMFWISCLPKTDKARYEVFRPCAKASGWMSVRTAYRKVGVQNFVWHRPFLLEQKLFNLCQSSSFINDLSSCTTNLATFVHFMKYLHREFTLK